MKILLILMCCVLTDLAMGFGFGAAFYRADPPCRGSIVCGGAASTNCYTGSTSAAAIAAGWAQTPSGKCLRLTPTSVNGFAAWMEEGVPGHAKKVLKATGLDEWQKKLNTNGKGFSSTYLVYNDTNSVIGGRVCPTNVYLDDSNKVTTGNCVYYSKSWGARALNDVSDDSGERFGFSTWASGVWYRGNIYICSLYGMRLPTFYETNAAYPGAFGMPVDASPTFAGATGVPPAAAGETWTATTYTEQVNGYVQYDAGGASWSDLYSATAYVRCVLP